MKLWHVPRREWAGDAFTEEIGPRRPAAPGPARAVPLAGVALLLAGGVAGVFLAISNGLALLDVDLPAPDRPAVAAPVTDPSGTPAPLTTSGPLTPRRPGAGRPPSVPAPPAPPAAAPITEASTVAPDPEGSPAPSGSGSASSSMRPSVRPSVSASASRVPGPPSRGPRR